PAAGPTGPVSAAPWASSPVSGSWPPVSVPPPPALPAPARRRTPWWALAAAAAVAVLLAVGVVVVGGKLFGAAARVGNGVAGSGRPPGTTTQPGTGGPLALVGSVADL